MRKTDFRFLYTFILSLCIFAAVSVSAPSPLYAQLGGDDEDAETEEAVGGEDEGNFSFGDDDDDDTDDAESSDSDADSDSDGDGAGDEDGGGFSFGDEDADSDSDEDADSDESGDSDAGMSLDSDSDSDSNSDSDSGFDADSDTDSDADAGEEAENAEAGEEEDSVFGGGKTSKAKAKKKAGTPNPDAPQFPSNGKNAGDEASLTLDGITYRFRWCPSGTFQMGSPVTEDGRKFDEKQFEVKVPHGFWMLETEVTFEMFASFVKATGYKTDAERDGVGGYRVDVSSGHISGPDPTANWKSVGYKQEMKFPVTNITWYDAQKFTEWLNSRISTTMEPEDSMRRALLPTEMQWEYACRAGKTTRYNTGDRVSELEMSANLRELNQNKTLMKSDEYKRTPWTLPVGGPYRYSGFVGSFAPNPWGLYDMHGNVWEWCADCYADYELAVEPAADAEGVTDVQKFVGRVGPDMKNLRVMRGGGWNTNYIYARCASRGSYAPSRRFVDVGFRFLILPLDVEEVKAEEEESEESSGGSLFGDDGGKKPEKSGGDLFGDDDDTDSENDADASPLGGDDDDDDDDADALPLGGDDDDDDDDADASPLAGDDDDDDADADAEEGRESFFKIESAFQKKV